MSMDGKWKRVSAENVDAIIKELGITEAAKAASMKTYFQDAELIEEFSVGPNSATRKSWVNGELKQDIESKFGEWIEKQTTLGKTKIFGTKVSDSRIEVVEEAEGRPSGKSAIFRDGDKLIIEYTVNGVTMKRVFEKV